MPAATTSSTWAGSTTFPTALEGALKLKEISYIHAEGLSRRRNEARAHRPRRRDDAQRVHRAAGRGLRKSLANVEEIKARGGPVIAVVEQGDQRVAANSPTT